MGTPPGLEELVELVRNLTPENFTPETFAELMAKSGIDGAELPEGTAGINEILNTVPAELSAKILTEYFNELYVQYADAEATKNS